MFATEVADDRFRETPGTDLLTALRGKDVLVVFVESYGRYAVHRPEYSDPIGELLAELEKEGPAENTIVLYCSDHGGALPRGLPRSAGRDEARCAGQA